jgi:hypothetical protein
VNGKLLSNLRWIDLEATAERIMTLAKLCVTAFLLLVVSIGCRRAPTDPIFAKRAPGERATLAWDYPIASEPKISGFALKQSASPEGPYRTVVKVAADQRKVDFQVNYEPGKSRSYYVVVALEGETESAATNAIEIHKSNPPD